MVNELEPKYQTRTYRGLDCVYELTPIPIRTMDWLAFDPDNPEASYVASGATLEELKADIDRYHEENDDAVRSEV